MINDHDEAEDTRVVADMSGIERRSLFGTRPSGRRAELKEPAKPKASPYGEEEVTAEQRRWYILGALRASFMIGAVYAVGFGLLILLMILLWGH